MTHYNNWGEIPEELQIEIVKKFHLGIDQCNYYDALLYAANGELFQWAISQGLINQPEPVEGWFVPKSRANVNVVGDYYFHPSSAIPLIKNPDGTYSEVKDD